MRGRKRRCPWCGGARLQLHLLVPGEHLCLSCGHVWVRGSERASERARLSRNLRKAETDRLAKTGSGGAPWH